MGKHDKWFIRQSTTGMGHMQTIIVISLNVQAMWHAYYTSFSFFFIQQLSLKRSLVSTRMQSQCTRPRHQLFTLAFINTLSKLLSKVWSLKRSLIKKCSSSKWGICREWTYIMLFYDAILYDEFIKKKPNFTLWTCVPCWYL